jgi:hypothetical protein
MIPSCPQLLSSEDSPLLAHGENHYEGETQDGSEACSRSKSVESQARVQLRPKELPVQCSPQASSGRLRLLGSGSVPVQVELARSLSSGPKRIWSLTVPCRTSVQATWVSGGLKRARLPAFVSWLSAFGSRLLAPSSGLSALESRGRSHIRATRERANTGRALGLTANLVRGLGEGREARCWSLGDPQRLLRPAPPPLWSRPCPP